MSSDFCTKNKISFTDLFDGRLERFEVREHIEADVTSNTKRCLTDGRNYLWAHSACDGTVVCITRYGSNAPGRILEAIAETFDTDIFSEHEPQNWGFDTQEEWELAWEKIAEEEEAKFHAEIIKYVKGEPNELSPGTVGMVQANYAKDLVAESPGLVSPDKKAELMEAIRQVYEADHAVVIKLDVQEIAAARMAMTHEDDLPKA